MTTHAQKAVQQRMVICTIISNDVVATVSSHHVQVKGWPVETLLDGVILEFARSRNSSPVREAWVLMLSVTGPVTITIVSPIVLQHSQYIATTHTLGENVYVIERNPSQLHNIHFEGAVERDTRMTIEDIQSAQITNIIYLNLKTYLTGSVGIGIADVGHIEEVKWWLCSGAVRRMDKQK